MASWVGAPEWDPNFLHDTWATVLGFFILGLVAQLWLEPQPTATLAVSFLAGQMAASEAYAFLHPSETDGVGEWTGIIWVVLVIVGIAVALSLAGHWVGRAVVKPREPTAGAT
jgi:hypothetical protein